MTSATDLKNKGNQFLQEGKFEDAVKCYTSAIEQDPKNHVLYSNRSAAYAKLGKFEDALKDAEECVKLNDSWAKGYTRKGAALEFLKRYPEAEAAYLKASQLDPNNESIMNSLLNVRGYLVFAGLKDRALSHPKLKQYASDPSYVKTLELIESNPSMLNVLMKDPRILETVSTLLHGPEGMDVDECGEDCCHDHESKPTPPPPKKEPEPEKPQIPEEHAAALKEKDLGNAAYKKKDFQTAIAHYDKALELYPNDMTFLTNKSAVYFEMGDFPKCIETCEKAVELGRDIRADFKLIAKALFRIGRCYEKQDDMANAKKYFDKALSEHRSPEIIKAAQALDKKIKEIERKSYINPEIAEQEKQLGNAAFSKGDFPTAMKHYNEAIKRNPDDAKLYSNRAACYSKLMEFACALKDCESCIKLDPTFIKGYLRKATCLLAMKDVTGARGAYR